jgi:hypothetical protein
MRRILAALTATTILAGGIAIEDMATADVVATLNDPITLNQAMEFRAPSHTIEVSDNGLIEIVVGGEKRYSLLPSEAAGKDKGLLLNIESAKDVTIKEAFGTGSEIILKNTPRSFSKVVSFTEDFLKTVPKDAKYVEVSFDLNGWEVPDGSYTERIQLQEDVWLEKTLAWDSSDGDPNQNYTDVEFVIADGKLTKRIPVEWLKTAQFPIYTDATFTFGAKELADAGPSVTVDVVPIGDNKAAICWIDNTDASQEGECLVTTISGTTLTFGAESDYTADAGGALGTANNNNGSACSAGPDRWVVVFPDDADADDGTARVASSTGTTVNGYGANFDFADGVAIASPVCTYVSTDTIVITYSEISGGDVEAIACTISTTYTLACGTAVELRNDTFIFADLSCTTLQSNKFICTYQTGAAYLRVGTVSGTAITLGSETQYYQSSANSDNLGHNLISPSTDKFAVHWGASSVTTQGLALGTVSGTTITLGATTTPIIATSTSFSSLIATDAESAMLFYQQGATDAATTFLGAIPIELDFGSLTFSTSTAETVDATTDPGSLHAAQISTCKFLFAWEDDNDTNDLFAVVGDLVGCGERRVLWPN